MCAYFLKQVQAHRRDLGTPNSIRPLVGRSNGDSPNLGAPTPPPLRESPISNSLLNDSLVHPSPAYRYQVSQVMLWAVKTYHRLELCKRCLWSCRKMSEERRTSIRQRQPRATPPQTPCRGFRDSREAKVTLVKKSRCHRQWVFMYPKVFELT